MTDSKIIIKLPEFVKDLATIVLGDPYCYEEIVERLNISNVPCLKLGLSKALGLIIIAGGSIVKVPQMIKIINAKSARGISFLSYLLETLCYIVVVSYNLRSKNPFSTWGETLAITFQNLIIILLMNYYSGKPLNGIASLVGALSLYWFLNNIELVSYELLGILQAATIPSILFSRIPQIYSNYVNGHTGQLAAFTVFNYFLGTLARVFTTLQEVDDRLILLSFILSLVLNTTLAAQMLYYWEINTSNTEKLETKKKQ